jgi:hypothetical protein
MDEQWIERVRSAQLADDRVRLAELFKEAVDREGREQASHAWFGALSAFDADAVTG